MIKKISKDILEAAKCGDSLKRDLLRVLKGTLDQSPYPPKEEDILAVIKKMIKSNSITMDSMLETASESDWSEEWSLSFQKLKKENEILNSYLPKDLSDSEIELILNEVNISSAKSQGQAIGMLIKEIKVRGLSATADSVKSVVERFMSK